MKFSKGHPHAHWPDSLALGGFGIGLTEFVIMGLLPEVAADFQVSEAAAGWLMSGYALAVVVGALVLTAAVTRFERKPVLAVLLVLFIAGDLVSAIAPDCGMMMIGRIVAALAHDAFFGIGAVVAADMVAPTKRPAQSPSCSPASPPPTSWACRSARCWDRLPAGARRSGPSPSSESSPWRESSRWFRRPVMGTPRPEASALNCAPSVPARCGSPSSSRPSATAGCLAFTYIEFMLTEVSGFAASTVPWLLIVFGVGLFVGNTIGGKAADRNVGRTLVVVLFLLRTPACAAKSLPA